MEAQYNDYIEKVSGLNQKKAFLSSFRETIPLHEKKRLVHEISTEQSMIEQMELKLFKRKRLSNDLNESYEASGQLVINL